MDSKKIGEFIKQKRIERGLTQQELGNLLYVTSKAVSKWERGLSIPDISLLEKLAETLNTDIYSLLQIKKKGKSNLNEILESERKKVKKQLYKRIKMLIIIVIIIIIIILYKFLPFGYELKLLNYRDKTIKLGVPAYSFLLKENTDSYSYKNLRSSGVIKNEMKNYFNYLEHISCNNTTYYYDSDHDITIVNYDVKSNILFNTIEYDIKNGNYCTNILAKNYSDLLGGLNKTFLYYSLDNKFKIRFTPKFNFDDKKFEAVMTINNYNENTKKFETIEKSNGSFRIENKELIYTRDKIEKASLNIPNETRFIIKKEKLILKENYVKDYASDIILE